MVSNLVIVALELIALDNKDLTKKQKRFVKHIHSKIDGGFVWQK